MRTILVSLMLAAGMSAQEKTMTVKRLTPELYTDDVESCVKFWVERMHFEKPERSRTEERWFSPLSRRGTLS